MLCMFLLGLGVAQNAHAWQPAGCHDLSRTPRMKALRHSCATPPRSLQTERTESLFKQQNPEQKIPAQRPVAEHKEARAAFFCAGPRCRHMHSVAAAHSPSFGTLFSAFPEAQTPPKAVATEPHAAHLKIVAVATPKAPAPAPAPASIARSSGTAPSPTARATSIAEGEADFADAQTVSNNRLGEIRGGFLTSSGMVVDVGLVTRTLVDGILLEKTEVNLNDLEKIDPSALQTLVQVDKNGSTVSKLGLSEVPQIINIIQNNRNNVVIDNVAILNVDVSNAARFTLQMQEPLLNHQLVQSLR